jgi:hypothetical protein
MRRRDRVGLLARLALAKQVPTAIKLDLELGEPTAASVVRAVPLGLLHQPLLLRDQLLDLIAKGRVVTDRP